MGTAGVHHGVDVAAAQVVAHGGEVLPAHVVGFRGAELQRHLQALLVDVQRDELVEATAGQALDHHQAHEAAADHRQPFPGFHMAVVHAGHHAGDRLHDPVLIRQGGFRDFVHAAGGQVAQVPEAAAGHALAHFQPVHSRAEFGHVAHAFVPGRRGAAGAEGLQVPRADAAGGHLHLHFARARVADVHFHHFRASAGRVANAFGQHG